MAEHATTQEIRPARKPRPAGLKPAEPPPRVVDALPEKLRSIAQRGHMVRASDVATLVTAAQAIEAQRAMLDRDIRVYARLLGDLIEARTQLLSLREMVQAGLNVPEGE